MRRRLAIVLSLAIIVVIVVAAFATIEVYNAYSASSKKPFYVGVTYCGNSTIGAEQLVDEVKNYTNLFVLDSGTLQENISATQQIGDYAINSGLNVLLCYNNEGNLSILDSVLTMAQDLWGRHFLGLYYNDEPGGRMLDSGMQLYDTNTGQPFIKGPGWITVNTNPVGTNAVHIFSFYSSGEIVEDTHYLNSSDAATTTYYVNGTIENQFVKTINGKLTAGDLFYQPNGIVQDPNGNIVTGEGNISQFEPYAQVWSTNPVQNYTVAANAFVGTVQHTLNSVSNQTSLKFFTSDYGLYWFEYLGGYNSVLAEMFGQQTDNQTLALVRGAADMQGKSWGVMIEPASQSPLNLQTGDQIYDDLQQAYENGAQYGVVFNYAPNSSSTNGLLQSEQFAAIQQFWTEVVQNPKVTNNVKGEDALVLPSDYGWGMRSPTDTIWGLWQPDNSSQQVWNAVQQSLAKYGSKLDIIYSDPNLSTAGKYQHTIYWNQTL